MSDYKFQQTSQNKFLDLVFSYAGILSLLVLAILCIYFIDMGNYSNLFTNGLVVTIVGMSFYRGIRIQKKQINSFVLTIDDTSVTQRKANMGPLTINFSDIGYILALKNGGILIRQKDSTNHILIPQGIENKDEIINRLESVMPITKPTKEFTHNTSLIVGIIILTLLAFFVFVYSTNPLVIIPLGIVMLAAIIFSFISTQKSKQLDKKIKRGSYFIILPFISVLSKTVIVILQLLGYKF
ncbi:MAG TPA: hypothetical protein P5084_01840 [Paludibacter sp.]|nr:hypothetical protein [Paludibacter sp.]